MGVIAHLVSSGCQGNRPFTAGPLRLMSPKRTSKAFGWCEGDIAALVDARSGQSFLQRRCQGTNMTHGVWRKPLAGRRLREDAETKPVQLACDYITFFSSTF